MLQQEGTCIRYTLDSTVTMARSAIECGIFCSQEASECNGFVFSNGKCHMYPYAEVWEHETCKAEDNIKSYMKDDLASPRAISNGEYVIGSRNCSSTKDRTKSDEWEALKSYGT